MNLNLIVLDITIVLLLIGLGYLIIKSIDSYGNLHVIDLLSLVFPIGAGIFTWVLFLVSWSGVPIDRLSIVVTYFLLVFIFAISSIRAHRRIKQEALIDENRPIHTRHGRVLYIAVALSFTLPVLIAIIIAIGRSYSTWDAIAMWSIKGYGIAWEGSIFEGSKWGGHGLAYPLNIPLLIAIFRVFTNDVVPGSKLIFPMFYGSLLLGVGAFWLRQRVSKSVISLGILLLGSVPIIFQHATIGYVNLPMACYAVLGGLWCTRGLLSGRNVDLFIGGLLLGLTSWTIVEGVLFSIVILVALVIVWRITGNKGLQQFKYIGAPFLLLSGTWVIFYIIFGTSGSQAAGAVSVALARILQGDLNLYDIRLLFGYLRRHIFEVKTWGLLFPTTILLLLIFWRKIWNKKKPQYFHILAMIFTTGLLTLALSYLRSFVISDFYALLQRGFPRYFLTTAILIGVFAILLTVKQPELRSATTDE